MPKASKEFPRWLTDWEQATQEAQARGIGDLDNPNVWFRSLCDAIEPVLPTWVLTFQGIYQEKLEDKTLKTRSVAKALRTEVDRRSLQKPSKAQGRGNSRAFGPTYGKGSDQEDDDDHDLGQDKDKGKEKEDPAAGSSRSKGKKRRSEQSGPNNKKKVRSGDDQDQDAPICEACGGKWHTWKKCYYVFPSKALAWFKLAPIVKDGVTHRLSSQEWKDRLAAFKAGPSKPD